MKSKKPRSKNFVPQLLLALQNRSIFECKLSTLPASYQKQPYNLAAKLSSRGGIAVNVVFSKAHDTFVVRRLQNQPTKTKTK